MAFLIDWLPNYTPLSNCIQALCSCTAQLTITLEKIYNLKFGVIYVHFIQQWVLDFIMSLTKEGFSFLAAEPSTGIFS